MDLKDGAGKKIVDIFSLCITIAFLSALLLFLVWLTIKFAILIGNL